MRLSTAATATVALIAALLTPLSPAVVNAAPVDPVTALGTSPSDAETCTDFVSSRTCSVEFNDLSPDGYVDVALIGISEITMMVYGGQGGGTSTNFTVGDPSELVVVTGPVPSGTVAVRLALGAQGTPGNEGFESTATWIGANGSTQEVLVAVGGGSSANSSISGGLEGVITGGGTGPGSALLVLGDDFAPGGDCIDSFAPRQYNVPADVDSLAFVAVGGGGTRGHNDAGREGSGAVVSGVLDVRGIPQLDYWVGCSGYENDGAGWGIPGEGGSSRSTVTKDGGAGGGATVLLNNQNGAGEVLVAAGGGGGSGGRVAVHEGGRGGSGGGADSGDWNYNGEVGEGGGANGGCGNCNGTADDPNIAGGNGESSSSLTSGGGGGGGGAGFPRGGAGGEDVEYYTGGGGGAGGSYWSPTRASHFSIGPNNDRTASGFLVLVPIQRAASTTLTVVATVSGPAAADARGPFTIATICTFGSATVFNGSFTVGIESGAGHTIDALPVGTDCTITETGTADATTPPAPQHVVLTTDPMTVTLDNVYAATEVTIALASTLDGDPAHPLPGDLPLGELAVHLECTLDGIPVDLQAPVDPKGEIAFTGAETWTPTGVAVTVPGVPVNAECTVDHTAGPAAVTYTHDGMTGGGPFTFTVAATAADNAVTVNDAYPLVPFSVHNASSGTDTPPDVVYDIGMACTYLDSPIELTSSQSQFPLGTGETTTVDNVPVGASCTTTEQNPESATAVQYSPSQTVTIVAGAEQTITNIFDSSTPVVATPADTAPLVAEVVVTGPAALRAGNPVVRVDGCTFEGEPIDVTPGVSSIDLRFPRAGGTRAIADLVVGAACDARLVDSGGGAVEGISMVNADPAEQYADGGRLTVNPPDGDMPTTMSITDSFTLAPLTVDVQVDGAAAWAANTGFTVDVRCTFDDRAATWLGPDGIAALTFTADGTLLPSWGATQLASMPVGSVCSATESATGGATTVAYAPAGTDRSGDVTVAGGGSAISIVNTFDAATMTIATRLAGNDVAGHENTAFLLEQRCTFNGLPLPSRPDQPGQFWLNGAASRAFDGLPIGAVCDAHETDAFGATLIEPGTRQQATLTADGLTVTFTNFYDVTDLTVRQTLLGEGAATYGDLQPTTVRVGCWTDESRQTRVPVPGNGVVSFTGDDDHATLSIPANALCEIVDSSPSVATSTTLSPPVTLTLGEEHTLEITRTFDLATFTVTKHVIGNAHGAAYKFTVACQWQADPPTADPVTVPLNDDASSTLALADGDTATRQVITGADCTVTEHASPDIHSVSITVTDGNGEPVTGDNGTGPVLDERTATARMIAGSPVRFAYTNTLTGAIPITGITINTALLTALTLLLAGAAMGFVRHRRRRSN